MPEADILEKAPEEKPTDRASFRLAAFGAVLVVVLFAGYGIGRLNESLPESSTGGAPVVADDGHAHDAEAPADHDDTGTAPHVHNSDGTVTPAGGSTAGAGAVGGLTVTSDGLTLSSTSTSFTAARAQPLEFTIRAAGVPVTTYQVMHDKPLHLILIRRDLSGFQHLHPTMAPDGTWSIPLTLADPGSYRAIADFTAIVGGKPVPATLGIDLPVAGDSPRPSGRR